MGARFSAPGAHPASCTMGTGSFLGVNSSRGVTLTPHPLLVLWSRKGRAIPLLPLWAVRPVQSLSACTRVHFTLPFMSKYTLPQVRSKFQVKYIQHIRGYYNGFRWCMVAQLVEAQHYKLEGCGSESSWVIRIFHQLIHPSGCIMALGGKGGQCRGLTTLPS